MEYGQKDAGPWFSGQGATENLAVLGKVWEPEAALLRRELGQQQGAWEGVGGAGLAYPPAADSPGNASGGHAWTWSLTCRASSEWNWIVIAGLGHDQVVQGSLCTAWKTCAAQEWLRLHLGYLLTAALGQGLHACLCSLRA